MKQNLTKKNVVKTLFEKGLKNLFQLLNKNTLQQDMNDIESEKEYSEEEMLIRNLKEAKNEWLNADLNLQYVSEDEFIEYYIYRLKAAQIKYEFFLRKAKEKGIKVNVFGSDIAVKNEQVNINSKGKNASIKEKTKATLLNSNSGSTGTSIPSNIEK